MAKTPEEQIGVSLPEPEPPQVRQPEPEANVEPEPEPPERPEWLPDKFKSPEELARSYGELESKLGEQGQTISQLQKQFEEAQQQQMYEQQPQWDNDDDYINELFAENPGEATRLILQQQLLEMQQQQYQAQQQYQNQNAPYLEAAQETNARLIADISERHVLERHDDYPDVAERVQEIMREQNIAPHELVNQPAFESHLEQAYKLAKYEQYTGEEQNLREQGYSQEDLDRMRKEAAQTLSARRSAPREEMSPEQAKAQALLAARSASGTPPWYNR